MNANDSKLCNYLYFKINFQLDISQKKLVTLRQHGKNYAFKLNISITKEVLFFFYKHICTQKIAKIRITPSPGTNIFLCYLAAS